MMPETGIARTHTGSRTEAGRAMNEQYPWKHTYTQALNAGMRMGKAVLRVAATARATRRRARDLPSSRGQRRHQRRQRRRLGEFEALIRPADSICLRPDMRQDTKRAATRALLSQTGGIHNTPTGYSDRRVDHEAASDEACARVTIPYSQPNHRLRAVGQEIALLLLKLLALEVTLLWVIILIKGFRWLSSALVV